MGRRLEKNYSFCEPCFLSLFFFFFQTAPHMHCLNLSASAAVKVSAIQNAENVARKVVDQCEENSVVEILN